MKSFLILCTLLPVAFAVTLQSNYHCAGGGGLGSKWDLWRDGTCLRGAAIWQKYLDKDESEWFDGAEVGPPYTEDDFYQLSRWGANYVTLSVPGLYTETPPYRLRREVMAHLEALVDKAEQADLFVVLSFRTGPGRNEYGFDDSQKDKALHDVWKSQDAQAAWVAMWRETARAFRGRKHIVGYDLLVEPNANSVWFGMGDPHQFYAQHEGSLYDWNPLATRLIEAVRAEDPDIPILVSGMNYGAVGWLPSLAQFEDAKIVYSFHQYEPYVYTHQPKPSLIVRYPGNFEIDGEAQDFNGDWLKNLVQTAEDFRRSRGPVTVGEYGVIRWAKGAANFLRDQTDIFESHGMNHALWLWESSHPAVSYDEFNIRRGPDPANHADVASSELIESIRAVWGRNTFRPSHAGW